MKFISEILYEDNDIIVCRKESGVPVQTNKGSAQDMVSYLKNYRAENHEVPEIFLIHRLDQPVEGIMVFAKTKAAATNLSSQFQQKNIDKYYLAVADSVIDHEKGTLIDYLKKDGKANTSSVVTNGADGAKFAKLAYQVLECKNDRTLVEIKLETGRHHQIRVQMSHAGYPICGDRKYNNACNDAYMPIALCAFKLKFKHPKTKKDMEFTRVPKGEIFQEFRINR